MDNLPEVLIDSIRYVPVTKSNPNAAAIMRALALIYTTPNQLVDADYRHLRVTVGEPGYGAEEDDPTIEQFVAELLRSLDGS